MYSLIKSLLFLSLTVFIFTGCTVNRKVSYDTVRTNIPASPVLSFSIATHDKRIMVVDGSQPENFVGYFRSTVAIAYPITTKSHNNFSDDFSQVIKNSMTVAGSKAPIIATHYTDSKEEILKKLTLTGSDRLLLFTVNAWITDSKPMGMWYGTELIWDIVLEIYNKNGELLISGQTSGSHPDLDVSAAGSVKKIQRIVDEKLKEKIDILVNAPGVQKVIFP